ncbi:AMP-binding protein, partial [Nocardia farcinica]|uniref:AMP-binding protein n=1 Tax=Nocardia farcinica TaxID=37329 RepID=UPI002453E9DC
MTTQESEILGLWNIADAEPDRIALVDPSGREVTYRELATLANRYATGLRDLGLRTGDVLVSMVHNCVEAIAAYFAAYQSGLYIVAVNWHLTGPEVAYILSDSEAKAFFADERFAAAAEAAADEAGFPATAPFSVGEINGLTPLYEQGNADAGRPDARPTG